VKNDIKFLWFVTIIVVVSVIFLFTQGCASTSHRQEQLQQEHPECFVFHDLTLECPNPFESSSAGFGAEVTNQKIKTKGKKKK
jgi:hypothetical protein